MKLYCCLGIKKFAFPKTWPFLKAYKRRAKFLKKYFFNKIKRPLPLCTKYADIAPTSYAVLTCDVNLVRAEDDVTPL